MARRRSKLSGFFKNAAEAAEDAGAAAAGAAKAIVPGWGTQARGGLDRAKSFVGDETARMIFGVVGYLGTNVTSGLVKQQSFVSSYPLLGLGLSVALTYFLGTMITTAKDNRKAILLGGLINAALQIAREYGGLATEVATLRGEVASYRSTAVDSYDNVTTFAG